MSFRQANRIDIYSAGAGSYTWTKYLGAKSVEVVLIGAGMGGRGGLVVATAVTAATNSQAGSGGALSFWHFPAALLGNTETVVIGAGTAGSVGGAAPAIPPAGGNTKFGNWLAALGGQPLINTPGVGSVVQLPAIPGFGGSKGVAAGAGSINYMGATGGGSGGGITGGTGALILPFKGGDLGDNVAGLGSGYAALLAGGIIGAAVSGGNGGPGNSLGTSSPFGGTGGGGGTAWVTAGNAGNGGNGGFPGGGGGGGGASVTAISVAANGGKGADGWAMVITHF